MNATSANSIWGEPRRPRRRWYWWQVALVVLPLLAILGPFVTRWYLLAGFPDIPEPFDLEAVGHVDVKPEENAFELYAVAADKQQPMPTALADNYDLAVEQGWSLASDELRDWLDRNRPALEMFRQASERPEAVYYQPEELSFDSRFDLLGQLRVFARLVRLETLRLEDAGDVEGAWEWHRALLRSGRHTGWHGGLTERLIGAALYAMGNEGVRRWAGRADVDAAPLRAALGEIRSIHRLTVPPSGPLKVDYLATQRLLNDPTAFRQKLPTAPAQRALFDHPVVLYFRGEPEITRRLARLAWTNWLAQCDLPRPERVATVPGSAELFQISAPPPGTMPPEQVEQRLSQSSRAQYLICATGQFLKAHDREQMRQAMLELALCLQIYHREHGEFPAALEALIGDDLQELPVDPFGKGEPIHYRREIDPAEGVTLWSIGPKGEVDEACLDVPEQNWTAQEYVVRMKPPGASADRPAPGPDRRAQPPRSRSTQRGNAATQQNEEK
ncbi:MAG: hypothetical protein ACT4QC_10395 [Planctomycetaceae bacterium]